VPIGGAAWRNALDNVMPFFQFSWVEQAVREYMRSQRLPERRCGEEIVVPCNPRDEQALARRTLLKIGDADLPDFSRRRPRAGRRM